MDVLGTGEWKTLLWIEKKEPRTFDGMDRQSCRDSNIWGIKTECLCLCWSFALLRWHARADNCHSKNGLSRLYTIIILYLYTLWSSHWSPSPFNKFIRHEMPFGAGPIVIQVKLWTYRWPIVLHSPHFARWAFTTFFMTHTHTQQLWLHCIARTQWNIHRLWVICYEI